MKTKITQYLADQIINPDLDGILNNTRMCIAVSEIRTGNLFSRPYVKLEIGLKDQRNNQWIAFIGNVVLHQGDSAFVEGEMIQIDPTKIVKFRIEES